MLVIKKVYVIDFISSSIILSTISIELLGCGIFFFQVDYLHSSFYIIHWLLSQQVFSNLPK
jgi:hypothetical protein